MKINEAEGCREDEEKRRTKAGRNEQRGRKNPRLTARKCEWIGRATHEVIHP